MVIDMDTIRMLKKAVQQGRSSQGGKAYFVPYVEPLCDARAQVGDRRVLARGGWAGANTVFFSILKERKP